MRPYTDVIRDINDGKFSEELTESRLSGFLCVTDHERG